VTMWRRSYPSCSRRFTRTPRAIGIGKLLI
jgi:hypothetical protein